MCFQGYKGTNCEVPFCTSSYCLNGGTCVTVSESIECRCLPDILGKRCEFNQTLSESVLLNQRKKMCHDRNCTEKANNHKCDVSEAVFS